MKKPRSSKETSSAKTSPLNARAKLIDAAIELFGEHGYEAASVRDIAGLAGQNIGSISYYFGDKKGLYTAVVQHIAHTMMQMLQAPLQHAEAKLSGGRMRDEEYIDCMQQLLGGLILLMHSENIHCRGIAKIFAREQFSPTHALQILYAQVHAPIQDMCCRLLGGYLGKRPTSKEVILRSYTLFGMAIVFRKARGMVGLRTGWSQIGTREITSISTVVREHIALVMHGLKADAANT